MKAWVWKYIIVIGVLALLFFVSPGPVKVWANSPETMHWLAIIPGLIFGQLLCYVPPKGP